MLEVDLLGPAEFRTSGDAVSLSPLERNLLAILALAKGTVVSTERIIDCLWGGRLPVAPRARVQGIVSSLRRKIGDVLITRHPGYLLDASKCVVDTDKCQDFARQARLATSPSEIAQWLRQALSLWRSDPLDGVNAPGIDIDRVRLTELRVSLLEELFAAELDAGHHATLIGELTAAVSAHPLRERLAGQFMLALYRSNRQADALKAYQAVRDRLAEELGSDPCADLRHLHASILRGDQAAAVTDATHREKPAQLPASVGHFTGRNTEIAALTRVVENSRDEPHVMVVCGAGGLGKTALVVRWAHAVASRFPDGQIFVDLHGTGPAGEALATALKALGNEDIPASAEERAARYRTLISGRRVLVIADNADSADQLLPLVPPTTASQLVATSRRRLTALAASHAMHAFPIEPLSPQDTHELLARIVGPQRLRDPAADRLIEWCGGWPLAIRHTAALLAARPGQSLASFADELLEHGDGQLLDGDHRTVRAALDDAFSALSPAARHLFRRLGLRPAPSFHLDGADRQFRHLLDELVSVNLIVAAGPGRYRFHSVVGRFARRCAAELNDRDAIDTWIAWQIPIRSEVDSKHPL